MGHWGYDADFLAACRQELTVESEQCDGIRVTVAERAHDLLGYYRLAGSPPRGELAHLFVDPRMIGQGIGRLLLDDALSRARTLAMEWLMINADPNAEVFYLHANAVLVGTVPSRSAPGRVLPRLELAVPGCSLHHPR
jgi:GNAT superfamily N-acetyltransferase